MKNDIEIRLVKFASAIIKFAGIIRKNHLFKSLADQIIRSATSCALNYGEARNAQSKKDFIHKASIVLKELRETHINLQIIEQTQNFEEMQMLTILLDECSELLAIFTASVKTAKKNLELEKR
ncbi:MAG: four helix bundle protein [Bacteroidales bacterium]|jgi:four helix bundle protein|nr:four helix bundle protein [Bacteroidales bacterium]